MSNDVLFAEIRNMLIYQKYNNSIIISMLDEYHIRSQKNERRVKSLILELQKAYIVNREYEEGMKKIGEALEGVNL